MKSDFIPGFTPADRVNNVSEYYFSRKLAEVAKLRAEGHDIISVSIGGPDRPPHIDVIETLRETALDPHNHSYQNARSIPELRNAFANWYEKTYGVKVNPDNEVLPLIGSKEGIMYISLAFLNSGDGVLIPNPGYPSYTAAAQLVGARPVSYTLSPENGYQPDFEELEILASEGGIKLMFSNYPNMPTGAPARMETFEKLVDFVRRHNIVLVHDNPYSFILNDKPMSLLQVPGAMEVAIEMNSLSKSHNMAGWRIACAISNPQFINWILRVKSNVDTGQFRPMMLAGVKALQADQTWYDSVNKIYWKRRKVAEQMMEAMDCTFDPGQRGLFLWGRIPDHMESGEWLSNKVLYEGDVFLTPGFIFGTQGERYVRISLCAEVDRMKEALERIKKLFGK